MNTPNGNVLGANNIKFKSNLFSTTERSSINKNSIDNENGTFDMPKSPQDFITLSTLSAPFSSRSKSTTQFEQETYFSNSSSNCSRSIKRSPQKSFFRISPNYIKPLDNSARSQIIRPSDTNEEASKPNNLESVNVNSYFHKSDDKYESKSSLTLTANNEASNSLGISVTFMPVNDTKVKIDQETDLSDEDFEIDEEQMKLIDKRLIKLIKKGLEKRKNAPKQKSPVRSLEEEPVKEIRKYSLNNNSDHFRSDANLTNNTEIINKESYK